MGRDAKDTSGYTIAKVAVWCLATLCNGFIPDSSTFSSPVWALCYTVFCSALAFTTLDAKVHVLASDMQSVSEVSTEVRKMLCRDWTLISV